ncbi:porphobilinogen synthase [Candidatus Anaplasma sp. TIGMIC]|uniref:porphobilinogen synthase n=1 Tax=Candidatus Anaplasma sp. TIGMIC TaxID=3020713 RepID=UPI00232F379F|nr:porphobilinogen synthase [Candidatus Anaplasma sp. TIGMIC]MDB1135093.1 porphobilinogen synthase [Candidatus Anaplasma sp. TIGMIC]
MRFPTTRLRRKRSHEWIRSMVRETSLLPSDLILPIFIHEHETECVVLEGLECMKRVSPKMAVDLAAEAHSLGISAVMLFPADCKKSADAEEAYNPENLICRTVRMVKESVPSIGVMADVALDPYTSSGHDGILAGDVVDNDITLGVLCKQAAVLAAAGCDVVAPSEMMDGRVGVIREFLDNSSFSHVSILSYSAKYCSCLHSPFRLVVGSRTASQSVDKRTYHMDPANSREALLEARMDVNEGADILLVKPGIFYLDVLSSISKDLDIPVFTYQVSGEYAMIKSAALRGWLDYDQCMYESLLSMKRAGARCIVTYAALEMARKWQSFGGYV